MKRTIGTIIVKDNYECKELFDMLEEVGYTIVKNSVSFYSVCKELKTHKEYSSTDYVKGYKDAMAVHEKLKVEHKGKWIVWTDDRRDYAKCSCCDYGEEGEVLWKDTTRFCPNCGADMRGGEE